MTLQSRCQKVQKMQYPEQLNQLINVKEIDVAKGFKYIIWVTPEWYVKGIMWLSL